MTDRRDDRARAKKHQQQWTVEVTVESLSGILLTAPSTGSEAAEPVSPPKALAHVAFSGSSKDMQVQSSAVCSRTGHLVVESEPLVIDSTTSEQRSSEEDIKRSDGGRCCWLRADWKQQRQQLDSPCGSRKSTPDGSRSSRQHSSRTAVSPSRSDPESPPSQRRRLQPHLMIPLAKKDSNLPKVRLCQGNRDSFILQLAPTITFEEDDIKSSSSPKSPASPQRDGDDGTSTIWSSEAGPESMPEIVELHVKVMSLDWSDIDGDDRIVAGTAYLVLFGHEQDKGSYVMELPVKIPKTNSASSVSPCDEVARSNPSVVLTDRARLRLKVKVVPEPPASAGQCNRARKNSSSLSSNSTLPTAALTYSETSPTASSATKGGAGDGGGMVPPLLVATQSQLALQVGSLVQMIERNEREARGHMKAQRNAIEVEVPLVDDLGLSNGRIFNKDENSQNEESGKLFCGSLFSFEGLYTFLSQAVRPCQPRDYDLRCHSRGECGLPGVVSMDSSIFTTDSMML